MPVSVKVVPTKPFDGQKPGTSGLRKKVKVFQQANYTENFVQCILDSTGAQLQGSTLVVGGDGRFYCKEAAELIVRLCAANGVARLLVGQNGILSTPAVSSLIRRHKALGGIVLTASHNPGGPDEDFGIKFNCENGGPAPDSVTTEIHRLTTVIGEYRLAADLAIDVSSIGQHTFDVAGRPFAVEVIDSVADYVALMRDIFDFGALRAFVSGEQTGRALRMRIDSMNGVTGAYSRAIFVDALGASAGSVVNTVPLPDFGGLHPDPNLTYARDLVEAVRAGDFDIGAAFDGDGDRNMIIGAKAFFVCPSDSLAVIAHYLDIIPYFKRNGIHGFARSMPTASAVDRVAAKQGREMFEVPTGWKYFGNLMDAGRLSLCGEESFGTGSDHIREKDGIWAALAWLSIMQHTGKSIEALLGEHWTAYGRNYFTRYDYENCDSAPCDAMIAQLERTIAEPDFVGREFASGGKTYRVQVVDNFSYTDPVDASVASKQGLRIVFACGSRIVMRLSGTGSSGSTIRLYIDSYEAKEVARQASEMLEPLVQIALEISQLAKFTGRDAPTVIT